jgi:hypothetical protein
VERDGGGSELVRDNLVGRRDGLSNILLVQIFGGNASYYTVLIILPSHPNTRYHFIILKLSLLSLAANSSVTGLLGRSLVLKCSRTTA